MIDAWIGADVTVHSDGMTDVPAIDLKERLVTVSGQVHAITDAECTVIGQMQTGIDPNS